MQTTTSSYQSQLASVCRAQANQNNQQVNQTNMASFVARLMSLSAHELQCLHSDSELMRHLSETHLLMESRLRSASLESKLMHQMEQQHHQQLQQLSPNTAGYHYYSPATFYLQQQQQIQHHNQLLQMASNQHRQANTQLALDLRTTPTGHNQQQTTRGHHHHHLRQSDASQFGLSVASQGQQQLNLYNNRLQVDESNQRHLLSAARSSSSNSSCSSSADGSSSSGSISTNVRQTNGNGAKTSAPTSARSFNPKKVKLSEYNHQQQSSFSSTTNTASPQITSTGGNQSPPAPAITTLNENESSASNQQATLGASALSPTTTKTRKVAAPKKYKGEFDEPTPAEVEQRQLALASANNYHGCLAPEMRHLGECACVLGSEFNDKPVSAVLEMIDQWRRLPTEQRVKAKWDVNDLPKDIPLSDIKKYEDLRREASKGRADFGGASKRKPLGIRGTRQFLLILYCLWGHPGREDVMQKEGYCPHCFAKIKKANEQSTLVRVVNHFNMKHRKGANPRLSPNRDISFTSLSNAADSQQVSEQQTTIGPLNTDAQTQRQGEQLFADLMLLATSSAAVVDANSTTSSTVSRSSSCSPEAGSAADPTSTTSPATTPVPPSNNTDCQSSST